MRRILLAFLLALISLVSLSSELPTVIAQGTVYSDTMDSAETGFLSTDTWDPTISFAYQNGQFVVNVQQPSYQGDITSTLSLPEFTNSRLTVDATIAGDPANKFVTAGCRHSDAGEGYYFGYWPALGEMLIWRRTATGDVNLAWTSNATLISGANTPRQIGIDCWTNIITGMVDGQQVLSAYDATLTSGKLTIGLGADGQQSDGLLVAFDNLTVTDNDGLATDTPDTSSAGSSQSTAFRDPAIDPAGALSDAFAVSLRSAPVASGLGSDTPIPSNKITMVPAQVALADFYAELYYAAPTVPAGGSYVVGFCFWADAAGNCTDIFLQDNGSGAATWGYGYAPANGAYQSLQSGTLSAGAMIATPGTSNFLSLTVYDGYAVLSTNTFAADVVLPLEGTPATGDVNAEVGFLDSATTGGVTNTLTISVTDFAVWDLSSGTVPADVGA